MKREELIKLTLGSEELQNTLIAIQREVQTVGLAKTEYTQKLLEAYKNAGFEVTAEDVAALLEPSEGTVLAEDELNNVSGGCSGQTRWANWCSGYNKRCPECTSWCDVYCAP